MRGRGREGGVKRRGGEAGGEREWERVKGRGADLLHGGASIHGAALVSVRVVPHPIFRYNTGKRIKMGREGGERGEGPDLLHGSASIHGAALVQVWVVPHAILRNKGSLAHLSRLQHMILVRVLGFTLSVS